MYCKKCGEQIPEQAKFCPFCGTKNEKEKNIVNVVREAMDGKTQALETLYNMTYAQGFSVAMQIVKNEQDALELLQDAYITAFQKLEQLSSPAKFKSWFHCVVANKCRDWLKKTKPELFCELNTEDEHQDFEDTLQSDRVDFMPEKQVDYNETKRLVKEILENLPDDQRLCVLMYYYDELSIGDIAKTLECSNGTVKSRLNYARKKIKEEVEALERKGTKLYGIAPLPFIVWMLQEYADQISIQEDLLHQTILPQVQMSFVTEQSITHKATDYVKKVKAPKTVAFKVIAGIVGVAVIGTSGIFVYNHICEEKQQQEIEQENALIEEKSEVTYMVTIEETENPDFTYPVFSSSEPSTVIDNLNQKYKEEAEEYVIQANTNPAELESVPVVDNMYVVEYQSEDGHIVALSVTGTYYGGGVSGASYLPYSSGVILDLETGEELDVYEVLDTTKEVVETAVKSTFLEDIMKFNSGNLNSDERVKYYDTAINSLLESDYDSFSYSLCNEGAIVWSQKYQLGPQVLKIVVSKEELKNAEKIKEDAFALTMPKQEALEQEISLLSWNCQENSNISAISIETALGNMIFLLHISSEVNLSSREEIGEYCYRIRKEEVQNYLKEVYNLNVTEEELENTSYFKEEDEDYYIYDTGFGDTFTEAVIDSYTQITKDIVVFQGTIENYAYEETYGYTLLARINPNSPFCGLQLINLDINRGAW